MVAYESSPPPGGGGGSGRDNGSPNVPKSPKTPKRKGKKRAGSNTSLPSVPSPSGRDSFSGSQPSTPHHLSPPSLSGFGSHGSRRGSQKAPASADSRELAPVGQLYLSRQITGPPRPDGDGSTKETAAWSETVKRNPDKKPLFVVDRLGQTPRFVVDTLDNTHLYRDAYGGLRPIYDANTLGPVDSLPCPNLPASSTGNPFYSHNEEAEDVQRHWHAAAGEAERDHEEDLMDDDEDDDED